MRASPAAVDGCGHCAPRTRDGLGALEVRARPHPPAVNRVCRGGRSWTRCCIASPSKPACSRCRTCRSRNDHRARNDRPVVQHGQSNPLLSHRTPARHCSRRFCRAAHHIGMAGSATIPFTFSKSNPACKCPPLRAEAARPDLGREDSVRLARRCPMPCHHRPPRVVTR